MLVRRTTPEFAFVNGGGTFGVLRNDYFKVGMFDEDLTGAVDVDFFMRAIKMGFEFRNLENATISIRLPNSPREVFRRQRNLKKSIKVIEERHGISNRDLRITFALLLRLLRELPLLTTKRGRYHFFAKLGAAFGRVEGFVVWRKKQRRP